MRLSVAIQHHPARSEILSRVISGLTPLHAEVVRDPEPDGDRHPWRTYRLALERTPEWATHRLIVQDDALPCVSFPALLRAAVEAQPDRLLALCVCGRPTLCARDALAANARGDAWIVLRRNQWVPVIALVWPARLVRPALEWVAGQSWPREFYADDEIVGRIARGLGETVLATVPSLVQHEDVTPSLIGKRHRAGGDPGRVAALFHPDPGLIDWSRGPRE